MNSKFEQLGHVSTEGGPLLVIDRDDLAQWQGIEGKDYARADQLLALQRPGAEIDVGPVKGILWDMPTGTAYIFRVRDGSLLINRPWPRSNDPETASVDNNALAQLPRDQVRRFGTLNVRSSWIAVLWAPEPGLEIFEAAPQDGLELSLSVGNSAIVVRLSAGAYGCYHEEVRLEGASAWRCWLIRDGP